MALVPITSVKASLVVRMALRTTSDAGQLFAEADSLNGGYDQIRQEQAAENNIQPDQHKGGDSGARLAEQRVNHHHQQHAAQPHSKENCGQMNPPRLKRYME